MRILSLSLKNHYWGWGFDETDFSSNLMLLVGISGAGKTQILKGILDLQKIAKGESINGLEWKIKFLTVNNIECIWEGGFDTLEQDEFSFNEQKQNSLIIYEKLIANDNILIERNQTEIKFNRQLMPKLSPNQSMIFILKEESLIKDVSEDIARIKYRDRTINILDLGLFDKSVATLNENYKTLEDIIDSNEDIRVKLYLVYEKKLNIFEIIKHNFIEIFPQIEDIKIRLIDSNKYKSSLSNTSLYDKAIPIICIKQKSVNRWISENNIASGMLQTIIHLAELYLSPKETIILIDEFENSLGINCIDILTDELIHANKDIQFILTSHHPYIINNIPYEYWKIVTRQGGHITIHDASEYNLGKSKQEAFIQLTKILEKQF